MLKNLPATREIRFRSLGWEDPLEKEGLPSPVFLPGESHGQRSLAGYSPWGCKDSDTTGRLALSLTLSFGYGTTGTWIMETASSILRVSNCVGVNKGKMKKPPEKFQRLFSSS